MRSPIIVAALLLICAAPVRAAQGPDSLVIATPPESHGGAEPPVFGASGWRRMPFGERLLTDPRTWDRPAHGARLEPVLDYNRVDPLRLGLAWEAQAPGTMFPRLGARMEYATGRRRWLYGAQFEQPLAPHGALAVGVSMVRRTDHNVLQQVEDVENTLALLFARQDWRDYFEREGFGAYAAVRVRDLSTVSLHVRNDTFRSLSLRSGTRSWFLRDHPLRDNPAVDEGDIHAVILRMERLAHRTERGRPGVTHWLELERAGGTLGGFARYTRLLGDVRSVLRLTPATTLAVRAVAGHTADGALPRQKEFVAGGVDGLRAHAFDTYRGDQLLLAQAEYDAGLWRLRTSGFEGGLHALAFVDAGHAWRGRFAPGAQHFAADGGFGVGTSEDNLRVYFARNLQRPRAAFIVSARLQRPF
jgi:hypothetical protein